MPRKTKNKRKAADSSATDVAVDNAAKRQKTETTINVNNTATFTSNSQKVASNDDKQKIKKKTIEKKPYVPVTKPLIKRFQKFNKKQFEHKRFQKIMAKKMERKMKNTADGDTDGTSKKPVSDISTTKSNPDMKNSTPTKSNGSMSTKSNSSTNPNVSNGTISNAVRKQQKEVVFNLNKKLSFLANHKNQVEIEKIWAENFDPNLKSSKKFQPSAHTLNTMANFYVRLGQPGKAETFITQLKEIEETKAANNTNSKMNGAADKATLPEALQIGYTALLKGYLVDQGDIPKARNIVNILNGDKKSSKFAPIPSSNARTWPTFFRGCLRWGETAWAVDFFENQFKKTIKGDAFHNDLDPAALEYFVKILTAALKLKTAKSVLENNSHFIDNKKKISAKEKDQRAVASFCQCYLAMARGRIRLVQRKQAKKDLEGAEACMKVLEEKRKNDVVGSKSKNKKNSKDDKNEDVDDEKINSDVEDADNKLTNSMAQFLRHNLADMRLECKDIRNVVQDDELFDESDVAKSKREAYFNRFLFKKMGDNKKSIQDIRSLKTVGFRGKIPENLDTYDDSILEKPILEDEELVLELGPGTGEWLIENAQAFSGKKDDSLLDNIHDDDAPNSDNEDQDSFPRKVFIGAELRHDRCVKIFEKALFQKLDNVFVTGGDANSVVENCCGDESVSMVVSNFPEPPFWHENTGSSKKNNIVDDKNTSNKNTGYSAHQVETQHLLTKKFINEILAPKIQKDGEFVVFSDNRYYCEFLIKEILDPKIFKDSSDNDLGDEALNSESDNEDSSDEEGNNKSDNTKKSKKKSNIKKKMVFESGSGFRLFSGKPQHFEQSFESKRKTYFDRLWSAGKKKERFFFRVAKI